MLRFKKEDGNNYPKWNTSKLNEIADVRDGTHDSPKYLKEGYPFITSKNLMENGKIDLENINFISKEDFEKINQRSKVDCGDILFGMIGTIGKPVLVQNGNFAIKNVALIKPNYNVIDNRYLYEYFNGNQIENQFRLEQTGGTQKFVSLSIIRNLNISYPCKEEQNKIADFLTEIDNVIECSEKEVESLEQQKKGLIQKIFSQEIRFKNENGSIYPDWEKVMIKNCLNYQQPGKYIVKSTDYKDNYETPVLTANKAFILGYTNETDGIFTETPVIIYDDFTMDMKYVDFKFKIKSSAIKILSEKENCNLYFMYNKLISLNLETKTHHRTYISEVEKIEIDLPSVEEQKKIAEFLSSFDEAIEAAKEELETWKNIKKGLLQQMFE